MQRVVRRTAIACLSAAVVAGCSSGSGRGPDAAQTVMMSAARSEAASTFHLSVTEKLTSVSGTPFLGMTGASMQGDVDLSTHSARLTGTLVGAASKPGAAIQSLSFSVIQIGNESWESIGGSAGSGPARHWTRSDAASSTSQIPDPGKFFAALKSRATQVRLIGRATVGGLVTDHYELVGPATLLDSLGGGASGSQGTPPPGPVSVQVWVDRANLIRKLTTTVKESTGVPGQVESAAVSAEFTDYGEAVQIQPPPADLVVPGS